MLEREPVGYVDRLLQQGLELGASDLHLEPLEKGYQVRARVDGLLRTLEVAEDKGFFLTVASRLKLLAGLDIGQQRLPQDGSFVWSNTDQGRKVNVRLSTLPITDGEKLVLRILAGHQFSHFSDLGMNSGMEARFRQALENPGLVLVTGAAGAGKTTTLYTVLKQFDRRRLNVVTLEEPVEYRLEGVQQVQINRLSGLDFANGLRAILRQDPNVILVGEIRDAETAKLSLRAALTGHLVLSTLHTTDACQAPVRLIEMGVEPYLVASGLNAVLAQKLVRKICAGCQGLERHCRQCGGTGFDGRTGAFQLLLFDAALRETLMDFPSSTRIREKALENKLLYTSKRFDRQPAVFLQSAAGPGKGAATF